MHLLDEVKEEIKRSIPEIEKTTKKKYKEFLFIVEKIQKEIETMTLKEELGTYIIFCQGDPCITFEMALKNILISKHTIVFMRQYMHPENKMLMELLKNILKRRNMGITIDIRRDKGINQNIKEIPKANKMIYIGDRFYYNQLKKVTNVPIIYNAYGMLEVYVQKTGEFEELLEEIKKVGFERNIEVHIYETEKIEEIIQSINMDKAQKAYYLILTRNKEEEQKVKQEICKQKISINTNPFLNYTFDLPLFDLLK